VTDQIDEIERDLSRSRAELKENVQALSEKLTPGRVIDDLIFGGQINWDKVGGASRDALNLILPGALIGAGAGMFLARRSIGEMFSKPNGAGDYDRLADQQHAEIYSRLEALERDYPRSADEDETTWRERLYTHHADALGYTRAADEDEHSFKRRVGEGVEKAKSAGKSAMQRLGSMASSVGHGVMSAAGSVGHGVKSAAGSTFGAVGHATHSGFSAIGSRASSLKHGATDVVRSQQEAIGRQMNRAVHMYDSNPMLGVAVGLGLGALLGAMLPLSRQERQVMAEPVGKAATKVAELGQQLADKARDATDKVHAKVDERLQSQSGQMGQTGQSGEGMQGGQTLPTPLPA
jgi:hypothetical protein